MYTFCQKTTINQYTLVLLSPFCTIKSKRRHEDPFFIHCPPLMTAPKSVNDYISDTGCCLRGPTQDHCFYCVCLLCVKLHQRMNKP